MSVRLLARLCPILVLLAIPSRALWGATLPENVRQTTNSNSAKPQVQTFLEGKVPDLASEDPAVQSKAREAIVAEVMTTGTGASAAQLSAQFLDVYADVLNTQLLKLANDQKVRARLSVAIVACDVAKRVNNAKLVPVVVDLLDDQRDPVVLWAIKASKYLLGPSFAGAKPNSALAGPFVAAAKKYVKSGPMIIAAYDSLRGVEAPGAATPAIQGAVDAMQSLLDARREIYLTDIPEMPTADNSAAAFLSAQQIWKAQTPAQQLKTIQHISDLVGLASQRFTAGGAIQRGELALLLKNCGEGLLVISNWSNTHDKIDKVAKDLQMISPTTAPNEVANRAAAIYPKLIEVAQWKQLKPPPKLGN